MTVIAGRYQALDAAAAEPRRARDLQTAQTVWLRTTALPPGAEAAAMAHAASAQGLCHPSLVTLFDVVAMVPGQMMLAYEYVPAQTLGHAASGQPFNPRRAAAIVAEIAEAIAALHAKGVVHGGVSPSTVLLTLKGKAKLDRVADPAVCRVTAEAADDVRALGELLHAISAVDGEVSGPGAPAVEVIVARARSGRLQSAAEIAALLRRVGGA